MNTENLQRYLDSFGKQVVNRAKGNLQKAKGGKTKLEQTIRFEIVETADVLLYNSIWQTMEFL